MTSLPMGLSGLEGFAIETLPRRNFQALGPFADSHGTWKLSFLWQKESPDDVGRFITIFVTSDPVLAMCLLEVCVSVEQGKRFFCWNSPVSSPLRWKGCCQETLFPSGRSGDRKCGGSDHEPPCSTDRMRGRCV